MFACGFLPLPSDSSTGVTTRHVSIVPMKAIGLNTSLCLLSVLLTCLVVTPVLLSLGKDRKPHTNMSHSIEGYVGDHFERFGGFVMRNHRRIVVVSSVLTLFCGIGLFFIEPF